MNGELLCTFEIIWLKLILKSIAMINLDRGRSFRMIWVVKDGNFGTATFIASNLLIHGIAKNMKKLNLTPNK